MATKDEKSRRVKTADNIFDIFEAIDEMGGATVTEVSNEIRLAKSTVYEYLYTLSDRGYLVVEDGEYHPALRFYDLGMSAKYRFDSLDVITPTLQQLADETGEVAWFIVEEHGKAVYLVNALGESAVQTHARVGKREHLHCLASGKSILAHLPEKRISEIIEQHGLPQKTSETMVSESELREELAAIRERGYAINDEEAAEQVIAIAAPVITEGDAVVGGICVSGPARRMRRKDYESEFSELLLSKTDEISLRLNWEQ